MKFTTISKIPNTSQMLIIPFLSMHYITSRSFAKAPKKQRLWHVLGFRGPQHCKHFIELTCFRNALLYRLNPWVEGCGMIWPFHAFFPSVWEAGTYRRLTDDRKFLKKSYRKSHVPIALVDKKTGSCGGRYPAAICTAYLTVGLRPWYTAVIYR